MDVHDLVEEQCILRLPDDLAEKMRARMRSDDASSAFKGCTIEPSDKKGKRMKFVFFDGKTYDAQLLRLPTHVETYKTGDSDNYYKSQDVGQVLKVYAPGEAPWRNSSQQQNVGHNLKDGLTPPTKNIMEKRWSKNEYNREVPRGIQEMEDEIVSYLQKKPKEIWRFVEMEDRMRDWTDDKNGHVEESMMFGAEALERTYKGEIPDGATTKSSKINTTILHNRISPTLQSTSETPLFGNSNAGSAIGSPMAMTPTEQQSRPQSRTGDPLDDGEIEFGDELMLNDEGTGDNLEDLGDFDAFLGLDLDGNGMGDGSDDKKTDELSSLKDDLRKKKSEVEDQKFFLNDCDETMRKQIKEDISFLEGEIKELEEKIRALES